MKLLLTVVGLFLLLELASGQSKDPTPERTEAARKSWLETKQKLEAAGIVFDLEKLVPAAMPDELNFAAHPLVAETYGETARASRSSSRLGKIDVRALVGSKERRFKPDTKKGELLDLAKLAADTNLDRNAAARKLLKALEKWEDELDGLVDAAGRPQCRFPIDWDNAVNEVGASVPFSASQHLMWRALSHLQLKQMDQSTTDTIALTQLARHSGSNPSLIGKFVTLAQVRLVLMPVREGIVLKRWNENALAAIEVELAKLDLLEQFRSAVRFELAYAERVSTDWIEGKLKPHEFFGAVDAADDEELEPHALYLQLDASSKAIFKIVFEEDPKKPFVVPAALKRMRAFAGEQEGNTPTVDEKQTLRSHAMVGIRSLREQANLNLARIAIAIERFRLENDKLPKGLAELSPKYLPRIPPDPMTGNSPFYKIRDDGSPVIYSVGWDGDDDGGNPIASRDLEEEDGDWVWQAP